MTEVQQHIKDLIIFTLPKYFRNIYDKKDILRFISISENYNSTFYFSHMNISISTTKFGITPQNF